MSQTDTTIDNSPVDDTTVDDTAVDGAAVDGAAFVVVEVLPTDLIEPKGILQDGMFQDGDLVSNVTVWLDLAVADLEKRFAEILYEPVNFDEAATAFVYHRAFQSLALKVNTLPSSSKTFENSTNHGQERVNFWNNQAKYYERQYKSLIEPLFGNEQILSETVSVKAVW